MKENQVLRDRWEMISNNIKPESESVLGEEAAIVVYERMMREQRGEGLRLNSLNSQPSKAETEGQCGKMSYNDFLKGGKKLNSIKNRGEANRRKNRVYSESKKTGNDTYL
jgi:hypothetical protein